MSTRISYDNTKIAVAKVIEKRGGVFTREFLQLDSHYLFYELQQMNHRTAKRTSPAEAAVDELLATYW